MRSRIHFLLLVGVLLAFFLTGCETKPSKSYSHRQPEQLEDGIEVGSQAEVQLDKNLLGNAVQDIKSGKFGELQKSRHSSKILTKYVIPALVFSKY